MRITRLAFAATIALAACQKMPEGMQVMNQAHTDSARTAIEAANQAFAGHMMAGHVDSMVAMYTSDAHVMAPNMAGMVGTEAIRAGLNGMMAEGKPTAFALHTTSLTVIGDHAVEAGSYEWTMNGPNNQPVTDKGKYVVEWERQGGTWKLKNDIWNSDNPPMAMPAPARPGRRS